jgi:hypothetical protein
VRRKKEDVMKKVMVVFAWLFVVLIVGAAWASAPPEPDYVPLCESPQDIAPLQAAGGSAIYDRSDVVWNGKDYAVAWVDGADNHLHFRRFFADGTPAAAGLIPSTLTSLAYPPSLVWNGSGYGVAWMAWSGSYYQIYFARLDANGALIGGSEVKASFVGSGGTVHCLYPSLAWSGSGYCVAWCDPRNSSSDIFATLLNSDGTIANSGDSHDLVLCNASNDQNYPSVAWSKGAGLYKVVWEDYRSGTHNEIWGASLTPSGAITKDISALVSGASSSYSYSPALCDTGNGLGLAWYDYRDSNYEIYFARLTASGAKLGADVRLTSDGADSFNPRVVWTGAEYGVFWEDNRSGNIDLWFQRVSAAGAVIGSNTQVTVTSDMGYPGAAFARYGYLATGTIYTHANFVQAWGCNYASQPPCPENLVAYNVTGSTATISWLPAIDNYTDIAYYQVYRNNALVGQTSDTYFTDTGLSANTTYEYAVRTVNAAQYTSTGCGTGSSIYVKSNATLTLTVNKSQPDAVLSWTDASMNNYNVFRGTSPQVMQQIGSTSGQSFSDKNALMGNNLYFYTVDEPGQ